MAKLLDVLDGAFRGLETRLGWLRDAAPGPQERGRLTSVRAAAQRIVNLCDAELMVTKSPPGADIMAIATELYERVRGHKTIAIIILQDEAEHATVVSHELPREAFEAMVGNARKVLARTERRVGVH